MLRQGMGHKTGRIYATLNNEVTAGYLKGVPLWDHLAEDLLLDEKEFRYKFWASDGTLIVFRQGLIIFAGHVFEYDREKLLRWLCNA